MIMEPQFMAGLSDSEFQSAWFALSPEMKSTLDPELRRTCVQRYSRLAQPISVNETRRSRTSQLYEQPTPFRITSATDLLRRDFQPIKYLVHGLIPEGLHILASRPKVGKSWFSLDLAVAVATGGKFLGRQVDQGNVLYLGLEDTDRRMHSRLLKLGAQSPDALGRLSYATQWPRGTAGASAITEWINNTPGAKLVVVDVFTKLREVARGRETAYQNDYADTSALKPPPDRAVTILLVHHTRKAESDDPLDEVSGTLGIGGAADGALILKRARGEDEAEMHLIGRDLEEEGQFAVKFNRSTCRWEFVGDAWRVQIGRERRQILDALAAEPLGPQELAMLVGKTRGSIRFLLHKMVADHQIDRGLDGRYRVIEKT